VAKSSANHRVAALAYALRSCPIFSGLPAGDLEAVAEFSQVKNLAKGQYLFSEGETVNGFYIVRTGIVNVHRTAATGKEQVIHLFRAGESFAEAALVSATGYPANARAVEESQVILVPKSGMLHLLQRRPDLALRMLASMSMHLRTLVGAIEDMTLKDVETRLANWLLKRCPHPLPVTKVSVPLEMTKTVLAAELGTRSETLSRTFAKMKRLKLIAVRAKALEVLDPPRLEHLFRERLGETDA
jgi:CRP/FNR family transcriptional regulator, dissimilatory nitrate respiration regulator